MPTENKQNIWLELADVKPIALLIDPKDEQAYREAEKLVNTLWNKWRNRFGESTNSHEVLARVAFQFARLYMEAYSQNQAVNGFLTDFEKRLDELVIKM